MANRKTSHIPKTVPDWKLGRHLVDFSEKYGVGNARVSVMAACGQARDGVVEAVLTCQVRNFTILQPSDQMLNLLPAPISSYL